MAPFAGVIPVAFAESGDLDLPGFYWW